MAKSLSFSYTCLNQVAVPQGTDCPYSVSGAMLRCSNSSSPMNGVVALTSIEGGMMQLRAFKDQAAIQANLQGIGGSAWNRSIVSDNSANCDNFLTCPWGETISAPFAHFVGGTVAYTGEGAQASCPYDSVITNITSAAYGSCNSTAYSVAPFVEELCLSQTNCTVGATDFFFNNTCAGQSNKTLSFKWLCL